MLTQQLDRSALHEEFGVACQRLLPTPALADPPFGCMWCVVPPAGSSDPDQHGQGELILVLAGRGSVEVDGETVAVSAGDLVHLPSHSVHVVRNESASAELSFLSLYWPAAEPGAEPLLGDADGAA